MSILFYCHGDEEGLTIDAFRKALPDQLIDQWPSCDKPSDVTDAIVWKPPIDFFDGLINLKRLYTLSAGVDHLLDHPKLPAGVSIARLTDAGMAQPMSEYILYGVLHAQRQMNALMQAQKNLQWRDELTATATNHFRVGILGAGELGLAAAKKLRKNDYSVSCWSRSEKNLKDISHFAGASGLDAMLPTVQVLVCLLPLTNDTKGILNAELLGKLPNNAFLINPGRGEHLDEAALLNALESKHISGALLDVFAEEPLPEQHPFWQHPSIIVTPHVAATTSTPEAIEQILESMAAFKKGEQPRGLVNLELGY